MIESLHIQNIALIEDLTLNLEKGLNILSGETGAGKSIIIDSLNFVLGERADKTLIRNGAERAEVSAVFSSVSEDVEKSLEDLGITPDDVLILKRAMTKDKNECRINGAQVTLGMLKSIGEKLVDIHGQHEHQSLLKVSTHVHLLDAFGSEKIEKSKKKLQKTYNSYKELCNEFENIGDAATRERKLDVLNYQITELKEAELQEGEEEKLLADRKKFRNAEKILNAAKDANQLLNGGSDFSVVGAVNKAINLLNVAGAFDENLLKIAERLESAKIDVKDVADELESCLDDLSFDDYSLENVEKRLEKVRQVVRKYGGTVEAANEFLKNAEEEYDFLINADARATKLEKEIEKTRLELLSDAEELSALRRKYAVSFEDEINKQLKELGMPSAKFNVSFDENAGKTADDVTSNGFDKVEFLISANKGEPLKPLQKIISGGEMSRFMLALKNITARLDGIDTMVFDEIDTGISGYIAQVVAEIGQHPPQVMGVNEAPLFVIVASHHAAEVADEQLFGKGFVRREIIVPCQHAADLLVVDFHNTPATRQEESHAIRILFVVRQVFECAVPLAALDALREVVHNGARNGNIRFVVLLGKRERYFDLMAEEIGCQSLCLHVVGFLMLQNGTQTACSPKSARPFSSLMGSFSVST
jgi:DNA repair protein RecN (Recombination protein N)